MISISPLKTHHFVFLIVMQDSQTSQQNDTTKAVFRITKAVTILQMVRQPNVTSIVK